MDKANNQRVVVSGNENYFDVVGSSVTVSTWVLVGNLNDQWQAVIAKGEQSWRIARRQSSSDLLLPLAQMVTRLQVTMLPMKLQLMMAIGIILLG